MESYVTVSGLGYSEYEEKKSVFLGAAGPVSTEEEALAFLASEKKKYPDAKHHVYAYILKNDSLMRFSDDREPQGTAGTPILDMLRKQGITNVIVVVTRYFGGTLLGTGGLVRAYSEAANKALTAAGVVTYESYAVVSVSLSYGDYTKLSAVQSVWGFRPQNTDFGSEVSVVGSVKVEKYEEFTKKVSDLTAGRAQITKIDDIFSF